MADPGSIPVPPQSEAPPKKKKHKRKKNGGTTEAGLQGQMKKQKVDNDDVILVQSKANKIDAVPLK